MEITYVNVNSPYFPKYGSKPTSKCCSSSEPSSYSAEAPPPLNILCIVFISLDCIFSRVVLYVEVRNPIECSPGI